MKLIEEIEEVRIVTITSSYFSSQLIRRFEKLSPNSFSNPKSCKPIASLKFCLIIGVENLELIIKIQPMISTCIVDS